MKITMIKKEFNHEKLNELGYTFSILEGGYVSNDGATIVNINRQPYQRQVCQYKPNAETQHMNNLEKLRENDVLE